MAETRAERLQKLLQHQHLGDQKPSQLLRRMKAELGSDGPTDDGILRQLFLSRLSPVTRAAVAILPDDQPLEAIATAADRFLQAKGDAEKYPVATLSAPPAPPQAPEVAGDLASLQASIASLTATVARLEASLQSLPEDGANESTNQPQFSRRRSRSRNRGQSVCFYHSRFGSAARKCQPPCTFNQHSENSQA